MIGAVKTATPTFIPSPEPLSRLAQMSAMLSSSSRRASSASGGHTTEKEIKALQGHKTALLDQKMQIDKMEQYVQSYAQNAIKNKYNGDASKFIKEESKLYKDGQGFYAMRDMVLKMDNQYKVNVTTAEQELEKFTSSYKQAEDNNAFGVYYTDPNTNARVLKGRDANDKPIFYTNLDWLNEKSRTLGINSKGELERDIFPSTFKPGGFSTKLLDLAKLGAWNPETNDFKSGDQTIRITSNSRSLKHLGPAVENLLSETEKKDMWNEFYQWNYELKDSEKKGLSKSEQEDERLGMFLASKINPSINLLERMETTFMNSDGTRSKSGSGGSAEPVGPILGYYGARPEQVRLKDRELVWDGDFYGYAKTNLTQNKYISPSLMKPINDAYYTDIQNNRGLDIENTGDYFWTADGVPNDMNVFKGVGAKLFSIQSFGENRKPMVNSQKDKNDNVISTYDVPSVDRIAKQLEIGNRLNGYAPLQDPYKSAQNTYAERDKTMTVQVAIPDTQVSGVLERLKTFKTEGNSGGKGKFAYGQISKQTLKGKDVMIGDVAYWILPIEVNAKNIDFSAMDATVYQQMNAKSIESTNMHEVESRDSNFQNDFQTESTWSQIIPGIK